MSGNDEWGKRERERLNENRAEKKKYENFKKNKVNVSGWALINVTPAEVNTGGWQFQKVLWALNGRKERDDQLCFSASPPTGLCGVPFCFSFLCHCNLKVKIQRTLLSPTKLQNTSKREKTKRSTPQPWWRFFSSDHAVIVLVALIEEV